MDNKKTFCGAPTHTRFAPLPKIFLFLLCFLILNCNFVFASSLSIDDVNQILSKINGSETTVDSNAQNGILTNSTNYQYSSLTFDGGGQISIHWSNSKPEVLLSSNYEQIHAFSGYSMEIWLTGEMRNNRTSNGSYFTLYNNSRYYAFLPDGATNNTGNGKTYAPGWQNKDFVILYKAPYFEFAKEPIGTTNFPGIGKTNMYYRNTLEDYTNSYGSFKTIGYLYIDKNYNFANIFFPTIYMTKQNFDQTIKWQYEIYDFLKAGEVGNYIKYYINVNIDLLTAPYIYTLDIKSVDQNLSTGFIINFGIVNSGSSGGIIIDSGDTQVSGDFTKDETTLGDINNTITEPYNPNNNVLNNMTSGDILGNMGYEPNKDPNQDLWDTIINGLKETLTGSGTQKFSFKLRKTEHTISSDDIFIPDGEIKVFISLFVNFWLLMQMFQFIKRTIDQINEGNLKVMHEVDADCYFF